MGQFSTPCGSCHSQSTWKNPPNFSHDKARYTLTGKHADLECAACHKPKDDAPNSPIQYRNFVAFQTCTPCHKDPHEGSFGATCERCHSTSDWQKMITGTQFDHSRTRFPLLGKHIDVECVSCHKPGQALGNLQYALCTDCHKDPHTGEFASRRSFNCTACHDENGWKETKFTVADHAQTAYPLMGKHAEVKCEGCHPLVGDHAQIKVGFAACTDCHKDAHDGQFAASPYFNRCDSCHDLNGYKPSIFDDAAHSKTKFALTGAHAAVPCVGCHVPDQVVEKTPYHMSGTHCADCHKNPHGDMQAVFTCEGCHKVTSWQQTIWFDHTTTKFPLEGSHVSVTCDKCHQPVVADDGHQSMLFPASSQCESCHKDVHQGQFKGTSSQEVCAECHTVVDWRPTRFDHNKHSDFKLDGAHENVPCRLCHQRHEVAGKILITYKGTPRECSACHD